MLILLIKANDLNHFVKVVGELIFCFLTLINGIKTADLVDGADRADIDV
jgi:hypothetical protein